MSFENVTFPQRKQEHDDSISQVTTQPPCAGSSQDVDGGYGWVCVGCMFLITANTWGVNGAFGVYLAFYLKNHTFIGHDNFAVAFIGGLAIGQILIVAPLVSVLSTKLGTRSTLAAGAVIEAVALVAASFSTRLWQIYLTQGVLFGWGSGLLWLGASPVVPQWFGKRLGLANAAALAGSGIGGLIYSLVTEEILQNLSLAWAFRITACSTLVVNVACTLLIKDRNKIVKSIHSPFQLRLFRKPSFSWILVWMALSVVGYTIVLFSIPENIQRYGYSSRQASVAGAIVNAGMAVGRPIVGYYSDRLGRTNIITVATTLSGIFCLCMWTTAENYATFVAFSFLSGCVLGTCWATLPPLLKDSVGIQNLPSALATTWLCLVIPGTVAEPIALGLRDVTHRPYLAVQILSGLVFLAATVCIIFVRKERQTRWLSII